MENLEEKLREAACFGDRDSVEKILREDIDINYKNKINGWTPLHWACKREHLDIVKLLIQHGADPKVLSNQNESPADVCSNPTILDILRSKQNLPATNNSYSEHNFVSNFKNIAHHIGKSRFTHPNINYMPTTTLPSMQEDDIILRIRICGNCDPDFIEVELPKQKLTYANLLKLCCEELQCSEDQVERIRKLPNTRLRNDNDVKRLENFQAIELVMRGLPGHEKPTNCYQSISTCKDQTILY